MYNHPYLLQGYSAERQMDRQATARRATLALSAKQAIPVRSRRLTWPRALRFFGGFNPARFGPTAAI